jgi:oxygen-independent coproporphyrinogen-3 oxidase
VQLPDNPANLPPWQWPRAAYVHVPFCAHHCGYCDFAVAVGQDDLIDAYLAALETEMASLLPQPQPVRTIFLGGGTPTHLGPEQLERLLTTVCHWLPLEPGGEFSVEANPEGLGDDKIAVLADHGVNRVSLGAQSFDAELLRVLDRRHSPAEVPHGFGRLRRRIVEVSLDLIFGVPGQTQAQWTEDLTRTLALGPDHVSTYGLTYEKGTPLWKERQRGRILPLGEEAELALYEQAIDTLQAAGFEHYEISNFARPGRRSRHNQVYWANEAYFGFGMGAARYVLGCRELNTRDLRTYLRRMAAGESATFQSEELAPRERARETMAVQLRRAEGIDRGRFHEQTGFELDAVAGPAIARHVELGLLDDDGRRVCLTRRGKYVADAVIERLL